MSGQPYEIAGQPDDTTRNAYAVDKQSSDTEALRSQRITIRSTIHNNKQSKRHVMDNRRIIIPNHRETCKVIGISLDTRRNTIRSHIMPVI